MLIPINTHATWQPRCQVEGNNGDQREGQKLLKSWSGPGNEARVWAIGAIRAGSARAATCQLNSDHGRHVPHSQIHYLSPIRPHLHMRRTHEAWCGYVFLLICLSECMTVIYDGVVRIFVGLSCELWSFISYLHWIITLCGTIFFIPGA